MSNRQVTCPVCLSKDGFSCSVLGPLGGSTLFECDVCGKFAISDEALQDFPNLEMPAMTPMRRAALSHRIRLYTQNDVRPSLWNTSTLQDFCLADTAPPAPSQQVTNIIRYLGDNFNETGVGLDYLPSAFSAIIGSSSREFSISILYELNNRGILTGRFIGVGSGSGHAQDLYLTLPGWELYEREKSGQVSGNYGFFALKFGDPILDPLLNNHVKPAISELGYTLVDMRDVSRAGVIDNLLRMQIRDAAFVLVDLTHENAGAYWEAGYAEGLGKPVLYVCEREKFEERKTHFDTNHCTTVLWDEKNIDQFVDSLKATLRRSLIGDKLPI
jgi:hypothetical protein